MGGKGVSRLIGSMPIIYLAVMILVSIHPHVVYGGNVADRCGEALLLNNITRINLYVIRLAGMQAEKYLAGVEYSIDKSYNNEYGRMVWSGHGDYGYKGYSFTFTVEEEGFVTVKAAEEYPLANNTGYEKQYIYEVMEESSSIDLSALNIDIRSSGVAGRYVWSSSIKYRHVGGRWVRNKSLSFRIEDPKNRYIIYIDGIRVAYSTLIKGFLTPSGYRFQYLQGFIPGFAQYSQVHIGDDEVNEIIRQYNDAIARDRLIPERDKQRYMAGGAEDIAVVDIRYTIHRENGASYLVPTLRLMPSLIISNESAWITWVVETTFLPDGSIHSELIAYAGPVDVSSLRSPEPIPSGVYEEGVMESTVGGSTAILIASLMAATSFIVFRKR